MSIPNSPASRSFAALPGFDGFASRMLPTSRGDVHAMIGGSGPPLLLLHGYPQTNWMWRDVAPLLAERYTVVAPDLAGYGSSIRPRVGADHAPHSKRAMAVDQAETMSSLGFDRFAVAGHDRGGRVGYRLALDHPDRVRRLAVLDIVPTAEVYRLRGDDFARAYWHWAFLSQAAPLPERLIAGDREAFFDEHVRGGMGLGRAEGSVSEEVMQHYRAALDDESAVEAWCEDYRAGSGIDTELDEHDQANGRVIQCPVLALWASTGSITRIYPDPLAVWRRWADDVRGGPIRAGHFLVEERPAEVAAQLTAFFSEN